jgi:hypothetical protein
MSPSANFPPPTSGAQRFLRTQPLDRERFRLIGDGVSLVPHPTVDSHESSRRREQFEAVRDVVNRAICRHRMRTKIVLVPFVGDWEPVPTSPLIMSFLADREPTPPGGVTNEFVVEPLDGTRDEPWFRELLEQISGLDVDSWSLLLKEMLDRVNFLMLIDISSSTRPK